MRDNHLPAKRVGTYQPICMGRMCVNSTDRTRSCGKKQKARQRWGAANNLLNHPCPEHFEAELKRSNKAQIKGVKNCLLPVPDVVSLKVHPDCLHFHLYSTSKRAATQECPQQWQLKVLCNGTNWERRFNQKKKWIKRERVGNANNGSAAMWLHHSVSDICVYRATVATGM